MEYCKSFNLTSESESDHKMNVIFFFVIKRSQPR